MSQKMKMSMLIVITVVFCLIYAFWGLDSDTWQYVLSKRLPKLAAITLTGGAIAIATLMFQTITNNRILTPSVLGLDAIYIFVQTAIVFVSTTLSSKMINANINFIISTVLMLCFSLVLYRVMFRQQQNLYLLLLVGMVMGTFFRSITGFLQMIMDPNEFALLQGNLFASFNNIQSQLLFAAVVIFLLLIPFVYDYLNKLDILSLGKEQAINLGVEYEKMTKRIFLVVTILIAVATALVGPLTFLGLLVVNIAYELMKTYKHSILFIASIALSISALVGGQLLTERIFNFNITLSVIINFVGGIYFVFLLLSAKQEK